MRRGDGTRLLAAVALVLAGIAVAAVPGTAGAFTAQVTNDTDTSASKTRFVCNDLFTTARASSAAPVNPASVAAQNASPGAYFEYRLIDLAAANTATDVSAAGNDGTYRGSNAKDTASPMACPNDIGSAWLGDGSAREVTSAKQYTLLGASGAGAPLTLVAWFKAAGTGRIMGFDSNSTGSSSGAYDRMFYVGTDGKLYFGFFTSGFNYLISPSSVVGTGWHLAVGTQSQSGGTKLYIDGNAAFTSAVNWSVGYSGYWHVGGGAVANWTSAPSSSFFNGSLRYVAAYDYELSAGEVASLYSIGLPG